VANTYGYGAMTNSYNDIRNSKSIIIIGGNPAEAHPVSMLHVLNGKENGAPLIVVDPRFTRTAAHADEYVRIRPGADVGFLWGLARIILENGWEDKEFIQQRVWGLDQVRGEIDRWTPEEVERVAGIPPDQLERVARTLAENRPGTLIWCMGLTQSTIGNNKTRAASILQLILGNIGKVGGGANIFRGHDNVQGATDLGVSCDTLPAYYGLNEGAWKHWCRVWDVDYEWMKTRFTSTELMEKPGVPVSRWMDGFLEEPSEFDQPSQLRAVIFWGHASNSQTRGPDRIAALKKADLLVVIDPYPTQTAIENENEDGVYLLPSGTTMEMHGSVTNSNRSVQWRQKVIEPIFEAKEDYKIVHLFAQKFGFADELFKHIRIGEDGNPDADDILREINRGTWTIGYTAQSPERLRSHMENQDKFDSVTLLGASGDVKGSYYCLPWPAWGRPEINHPGTPILYDTSRSVAEGGLPFRARWGVEREGQNLLAEDSYTPGSDIQDGYPELTVGMLQALGWDGELSPRERVIIAAVATGSFTHDMFDLTDDDVRQAEQAVEQKARDGQGGVDKVDEAWQNPSKEQTGQEPENNGQTMAERFPGYPPRALKAIEAYLAANPQKDKGDDIPVRDKIARVNWKTDLSGGVQRVAIAHGLAPYGNGKARAVVWNFPDQIPLHREPLFTPRRDLLPDYQTFEDQVVWRLPSLYRSIQKDDWAAEYPLALTSGRLVEFEGGGDETRSNKWLAEFQQQMFAEISPADASAAGVEDGAFCWVRTPNGGVRVKAMVTNRVGPGTVFMPFHFAGIWMGEPIYDRYPEGAAPYVVGEATNTVQTYGYDIVTQMQETKATLCRVEPA
jgi:formate dehydrogenase major subunit